VRRFQERRMRTQRLPEKPIMKSNSKFEARNPGETSRRDQFEPDSKDRNANRNSFCFENLDLGFACSVKYASGHFGFMECVLSGGNRWVRRGLLNRG
jgi:hypothetical protein